MSELTVKLKSNDYENGEFSQDQLVFSNIDHYEFFSHGENDKKTWVSPEVKDLGDAKEIIKGFTPGDPKVPGGGDGALAGASDS